MAIDFGGLPAQQGMAVGSQMQQQAGQNLNQMGLQAQQNAAQMQAAQMEYNARKAELMQQYVRDLGLLMSDSFWTGVKMRRTDLQGKAAGDTIKTIADERERANMAFSDGEVDTNWPG